MPKQPTIADLAKKLDEALAEIKAMKQDVSTLQQWKIAEDAYRAALKRVRLEEKESLDQNVNKQWLKVLKEVYPIIGMIGAIIYAYASTRGIH